MLTGMITREGQGQEYYRVLNLHQLAARLGITYGQAQRHVERGIITPNGEDGKQCPIFFAGRIDEFRTRIENTVEADA